MWRRNQIIKGSECQAESTDFILRTVGTTVEFGAV